MNDKIPKILYLSRGRGFSHAMNDLLILQELKKLNDSLSILLASYDKGYFYLCNLGINVFNLGLSQEEELTMKAGIKIWSLIRRFKPDLVISDEVFIVLHITKALKIPSILITHWFFEYYNKNHPVIPAVRKADFVIFVDTPLFHTIPFGFNVPLTFVGPIIREFKYSLKDKRKVREELGIDNEAKVIFVTPGGRARDRKKMLNVSIEAFKDIKEKNKKLILLTGELYQEYLKGIGKDPEIIVKDYDWEIDRLMVASDLAICSGSFSTTWELAYLGIPSISIPDIKNPIDQIHVNRMSKYGLTIRIDPRDLNKNAFLKAMKEALGSLEERRKIIKKEVPKLFIDGFGQKGAAEEINYFIRRFVK